MEHQVQRLFKMAEKLDKVVRKACGKLAFINQDEEHKTRDIMTINMEGMIERHSGAW